MVQWIIIFIFISSRRLTARSSLVNGVQTCALPITSLATAPAVAQSTSAGIGGQVTSVDGQPVAGAELTITHVESGTVSRATTDDNGRYNARGLRVGGPYTVIVTKAGTGTDIEEGIYLELNSFNAVNAQLDSGDATTLETVAVTASRIDRQSGV